MELTSLLPNLSELTGPLGGRSFLEAIVFDVSPRKIEKNRKTVPAQNYRNTGGPVSDGDERVSIN